MRPLGSIRLNRFFQGLSADRYQLAADPAFRDAVMRAISRVPVDFGGGCPPKKALTLAWLIRAGGITSSLDIGVYRGRSLIPQAVSHRDYTGGIAYGVDPFSKSEAVQNDNVALRERLHEFVSATDFERIYQEVLGLIDELRVAAHCRLLRQTSEHAARDFTTRGQRFGLIHVDGNHDEAKVAADVEAYFPLLTPGGFLVLDDVSWNSVKPAVEAMQSRAAMVFYESRPTVTELDYAVFWSGRSRRQAESLRASLARLNE